MPDRSSSTPPSRPNRPSRDSSKPSLGSRVKEAFEQGVEAIVEAIGSLVLPEPTPAPVSAGGGRRRPARTDHRFR